MIHYTLLCSQSHEFDGWFASSVGFEQQAERGLVECPVCGDTKVSRGLMAPAVPKKGNAGNAGKAAEQSADTQSVAVTGDKLPDHVRSALQKLRAEVETKCDYVGNRFADEARRIHDGESEQRSIYGETTPEQAEALVEDGIAFAKIPWIPRADS
jgi:hypothetical protein